MYKEMIDKYDIAIKMLKQGKRKEAEDIFLEMLSENRKNKYVLFQMGKIRLQCRDQKSLHKLSDTLLLLKLNIIFTAYIFSFFY